MERQNRKVGGIGRVLEEEENSFFKSKFLLQWVAKCLLFLSLFSISYGKYEDLLQNSPFIPYNYQAPGMDLRGQSRESPLEFTGVLDFEGEVIVHLRDSQTQKMYRVRLKDEQAPFYVEAYDQIDKTIKVVKNGVPLILKLKRSVASKGGFGVKRSLNKRNFKGVAPNATSMSEQEDEFDQQGGEDAIGEEKNREMPDRVYEAFKKYVAQKKEKNQASESEE